MNRDGCFWGLIILGLCLAFAITTTSVVISGVYWLKPEINATVETTCYIKNCQCFADTCRTSHSYSCGSNGKSTCYWYSYYTCYNCDYTFGTYIGDNYVSDTKSTTGTTDSSYCYDYQDGKEVDCYYQRDDPTSDSLTLTKSNNYAGSISYIVIFSVISIVLFGTAVAACTMAYNDLNYSSYSYGNNF